MAGRAHANRDKVFPPRRQAEGGVERGNAQHFRQRNIQPLRDRAQRLARQVALLLLDVLHHVDQAAALGAVRVYNLVRCRDGQIGLDHWHSLLLNPAYFLPDLLSVS